MVLLHDIHAVEEITENNSRYHNTAWCRHCLRQDILSCQIWFNSQWWSEIKNTTKAKVKMAGFCSGDPHLQSQEDQFLFWELKMWTKNSDLSIALSRNSNPNGQTLQRDAGKRLRQLLWLKTFLSAVFTFQNSSHGQRTRLSVRNKLMITFHKKRPPSKLCFCSCLQFDFAPFCLSCTIKERCPVSHYPKDVVILNSYWFEEDELLCWAVHW